MRFLLSTSEYVSEWPAKQGLLPDNFFHRFAAPKLP